MKRLAFGLIVLALTAPPAWAAGLTLTISEGKVSIDAQDVTLRQILSEWSRLGQTRIVNLERLTSGPITLKLENVPERVALDILLRSVPGYMALPREPYLASASVYDRILIMATTTTPAAVAQQRPQPLAYPGASFGGQSNVTQLRPPQPLTPGALPDPAADNAADQRDEQALANAAAAGLVPVQAPALPGMPVPPGNQPTTLMPPMGMQPTPQTAAPAATSPSSNPFNIPTGTARPGQATPLPPTPLPNQPPNRIRPPQADQ